MNDTSESFFIFKTTRWSWKSLQSRYIGTYIYICIYIHIYYIYRKLSMSNSLREIFKFFTIAMMSLKMSILGQFFFSFGGWNCVALWFVFAQFFFLWFFFLPWKNNKTLRAPLKPPRKSQHYFLAHREILLNQPEIRLYLFIYLFFFT